MGNIQLLVAGRYTIPDHGEKVLSDIHEHGKLQIRRQRDATEMYWFNYSVTKLRVNNSFATGKKTQELAKVDPSDFPGRHQYSDVNQSSTTSLFPEWRLLPSATSKQRSWSIRYTQERLSKVLLCFRQHPISSASLYCNFTGHLFTQRLLSYYACKEQERQTQA